jgi:threonine dehydratase
VGDENAYEPASLADNRLFVERARIVAEGAGAAPLAAALSGRAGGGKLVCVVSGGNIDTSTLGTIMSGKMP